MSRSRSCSSAVDRRRSTGVSVPSRKHVIASPPELDLVDVTDRAADLRQMREVRVDLIRRHPIPALRCPAAYGRWRGTRAPRGSGGSLEGDHTPRWVSARLED